MQKVTHPYRANHKVLMRHFSTYSIIALSYVALFTYGAAPSAFAQPSGSGQEFVTLVPSLPILGNQTTVPQLLNALFGISIAVAAMLAVLMFVIGGFRYMASEAMGSKGDAKNQMQSAVLGLFLVLASILILNTINPNLTQLNIFRSVPPESAPPDSKESGGTRFTRTADCTPPDTAGNCCSSLGAGGTLVGAEWLAGNTKVNCTFER